MVMAASPRLAPSERSTTVERARGHHVALQKLVLALGVAPERVRPLLQRILVRAHGLAAHANEPTDVWLTRAALHLAMPEAPAQPRGQSQMVQIAFLLVKVLDLPVDRAARILMVSPSRAERYAERARKEMTSRLELSELLGSGVADVGYDEALAALRARITELPLRADDVEALAEAVLSELEAGPPSFELASSKLLRAPIVDDASSPELRGVGERDSKRASLKNLSELAGPPTTRRVSKSRDEDSGVIALSSSKWPAAETASSEPVIAAPVATAAVVAAPTVAPVIAAAPATVPSAGVAQALEPSSETPSATPAVLSMPEPQPATVRTAPARTRPMWWIPLVAAAGVVLVGAGVWSARPSTPAVASVESPRPAPAAAIPAVPLAEPTPSEPAPVEANTALDPSSLPTEVTAAAAPSAANQVHSANTSSKEVSKDKPLEPARAAAPAAPATPTKPATPGSDTSLAAAMHGAVGSDPNAAKKPTEETVASAPADAPRRPPQGAVTAALGRVTSAAKQCIGPDDPISRATLVFGSNGNVQSVAVSGHAVGKPAEGCIKTALQSAKLPPFADPEYKATVTVRP